MCVCVSVLSSLSQFLGGEVRGWASAVVTGVGSKTSLQSEVKLSSNTTPSTRLNSLTKPKLPSVRQKDWDEGWNRINISDCRISLQKQRNAEAYGRIIDNGLSACIWAIETSSMNRVGLLATVDTDR
jgi:hypothetical protein